MSDQPFVIKNFDSYIVDKIKYKKLESYMPDPSKHILIIGATGRGKSTHLLNMFEYMYFDKLYVFAKDIEEDIYEKVLKANETIKNYFTMSRKKGVSCIYLAQNLFDVPKTNQKKCAICCNF